MTVNEAPSSGLTGGGNTEGPVSLTLAESIELVRGLLANGKAAAAENLLNAILEQLPDEPDALHLLGALRDMQGRSLEALPLIERSIALMPEEPGRWNDVGNVLAKINRKPDAVKAYRRSIELAGETIGAASGYNNLGRMLLTDSLIDAEAAFRRATELSPGFAYAWYNLSQTLIELGRTAEGVDACGQAIILAPHMASREHVARALVHLGHTEEAIEHYRRWLQEDPDNPVLQHHLAALTTPDTADRASDAYVEKVFDGFAASFDDKLASLEYRAPELIRDAFASVYPSAAASLDIADAGCGTGLCGPLLAPWARRLCGFDLSGGMLSKAQSRSVYTDLHKAELVAFLRDSVAAFDVIVSADTLCYFAALGDAMRASHDALRPGGHVFYTVEASDDDTQPHRLLPSGRYAHSLVHVASSASAAGLRVVAIGRVKLREEAGRPVTGWLVTLYRP
jgi:predicted TPR repeat methyltransferase